MRLFWEYNLIGENLVKIGEIEIAITVYRRAIELFPEIPEVSWSYHSLGKLMLQKGDFREAAVLLHKSIKIAPSCFELYKDFSVALAKLQEHEGANALELISELVYFGKEVKDSEIKETFTRAFSTRYRKGKEIESASGIGSSLSNTNYVREQLPEVFKNFKVTTVIDIPCGDFNWMKEIKYPPHIHYLGADIISQVIVGNQVKYGNENQLFMNIDLIEQPLPKVDLIICRDCFIHFSDEDVFKAINNVKASGSTYLLTTTFPLKDNHNIKTTQHRAINLQKDPFKFPDPLALINEKYHNINYSDKSLGMWKVEDLPSFD